MEVGLYGKLPSHGDFLRRRTSDAFVRAWDAWLRESMNASRSALGEGWLDVYLTSPAWRFASAPGACGPAPLVGLMAPSVDRVGRYFPLAIVAELPAHSNPVAAAAVSGAFFDRAEALVIETLEAERVDFEAFDQAVFRLAKDLESLSAPPPVLLQPGALAVLEGAGNDRWQVPIGSPDEIDDVFRQMLSLRLSALYEPLMLWWTAGSSKVEPGCLIGRGLPDPRAFAAMLDGSWRERQWRSVPARVEDAPSAEPLLADPLRLRFRSAAATDVGKVRAINQDSFIEFPESGVWAVADGLGGHSAGETASRMVCDAFADFMQTGTFEDTIEAACRRLEAVNEQLVREAARSLLGDRSGSTVVALLARGAKCAVIWAGDSRAYRCRSGRFEQLTRDHSVAQSNTVVTRAVGAQSKFEPEVCRGDVRPGDRYLLCSDGLTRVLPEATMRALVEAAELGSAVQGLVEATLEAGAPDNVTALLVEAVEDVAAK